MGGKRRKVSDEAPPLRAPNEGEILGIVTNLLGFDRVRVRCADGYNRICRIPGRYRKRMWIREGDLVLVVPWDFQFKVKGDIVWRYKRDEISKLREAGYIPEDLDFDLW